MGLRFEAPGGIRYQHFLQVDVLGKKLDGLNLEDGFNTTLSPTEKSTLLKSDEMSEWHGRMEGFGWKKL
jgi:hypothetical protein